MTMIDKSIIICSIVRNAEAGLKKNIPVINEFFMYFKSVKVFVYENDSTDNTKKLLQKWHLSNPDNIHISLNNNDPTLTTPSAKSVDSNPFFSKKRIEKMANIRNQYMLYIERMNWTADYLIVVDLDVSKLNFRNILTSFKSNKDWDAVVSFGFSISPKLKRRYHDTYALTMWGDENEPQTEEKINYLSQALSNFKPSNVWLRVASGFGGLAIYKFQAVAGLRYMALPNNDERVEVKCEHFSIYKQMMDRGYSNFYLNPSMILKYQDINFSIIWNFIKRKFGIKS